MDRRTKDSFLRVFLRSIPLLPAPEIFDLLLSLQKSQNDFDKQVNEAVDSLHNTSTLIDTLQRGVTEKMAQLQKVREEYERVSGLAQIEGEKAKPLLRAVEAVLGKEQKKERWIAFAMHFGFLIVGVLASDSIKVGLTHVWTMLFH